MKKEKKQTARAVEEIKKGKVKMRSKFSVWSAQLGLGSGTLLFFLILITTSSALILWLNINQDLIIGSHYGKYGPRLFLGNLPYFFVILFVLSFIIINKLLRQYDFSYKKPFLIILAGILSITILFSWVSLRYPRYYNLLLKVPFVSIAHKTKGHSFLVGQIISENTKALIVRTNRGESVIVLLDDKTLYPHGKVQTSDLIRIIGQWDEKKEVIKADIIGNLQQVPGAKLRIFLKPSFAPTPEIEQRLRLNKFIQGQGHKRFQQPN